jgi:hypothetical protein
MRIESDKQNKRIMTYRNKNRADKTFAVGDVVLKRQTQVSVGPNSAVRPKFTGPYHIDSIRPTEASADIVHYRTGKTLHAHFTDLQKLYHDQQYARLPSSFDSTMLDLLPDKYSHARYLASQPFDTQLPTQTQFRPQSQSGADVSTGADNLSQPDYSEFPEDLPLVDLSHISLPKDRTNFVLDLSDTNLEDYLVDRDTNQRQITSSQSRDDRHELLGWEDDYDPLNPPTQGSQNERDQDNSSPLDQSQQSSTSHISTEDADITIIREPNATYTITEYRDNSQPTQVHVETLDPTQRVTQLRVNPGVRPIQVQVVSEPIEGMIEDLPTVRAVRRPYVRRKRQAPLPKPPKAENVYERQYKSYSKPGTSHKYQTRSKPRQLDQANNIRLIHYEPP